MSTVETVTRICGYEVHEAANAFPMMTESEAKSLAESIKSKGQESPIVLIGEKILDGRNRAKACELLGLAPKIEQAKEGTNPWEYVVTVNIERRELGPLQKTLIRLACLQNSDAWLARVEAKKASANEARSRSVSEARSIQNRNKSESGPAPREATPAPIDKKSGRKSVELANMFGVGRTTVERAQRIQRDAPDAADKIRTGELKNYSFAENCKPKKEKPSVGLVGALLTETDIELDGSLNIRTDVKPETETPSTPEPVEKKTSDGAPLLKQARACIYAWEAALRYDWIVDTEHVDLVVKELNQLRLLTTQVIKKVKGNVE